MKKKLLLTLIIFMAIFYVVPVFAETEVSVCEDGCDYTSVDQVLSAMDSGTLNDQLYIIIDTWNEQTIGNHTLTHSVGLSFNKNSGVLNGNNSTITIPKNVDLWFNGNTIEIKKLKVNYTGVSEAYNDGDLEDVIYLDATDVSISDLTITGKAPKCPTLPNAIFNDSANLSLENVKIENFSTAIYQGMGNLTIKSSTINNNIISIISEGNVSIESSSVKNIQSYKSVSTKNVGDLKVSYVDSDTYNNMSEEEYCSFSSKKGIYQIGTNANSSISMERTMDINLKQQASIDDILSIFREDNFNINNFTITSSDEKIASIKNNVINLLKSGQVTITAANSDTHESYVLNLRISNPISSNPITSPNTFFTIGIILIFLGSITIFRNIRSEQ